MKKRTSILNLLTINFFPMGLSFMWNSLHPILLPAILLNFVPDSSKNTYLGLLTFGGLLLAVFVQPIAGAISDNTSSKWGKRQPFILLGAICNIFFLWIIASADSLFGIFIGYICLQISSNIAHGPMQGLIPDHVPDEQKGLASGIKNFVEILGLIIASLTASRLLDSDGGNPLRFTLIIAVVLFLAAMVTILATFRASPKASESKEKRKVSLRAVFNLDLKKHGPFAQLILGRFIFLLGVYGIQTFAQYYIRDVMAVENVIKATSDMMIAIALALVFSALFSGWLSDKIGPQRIMLLAMVLTAVMSLVLLFIKDMSYLTLVSGFIGAGMGMYLTSNWTMAVKYVPGDEAGRFLGLTNIATAGASAVGRLEGPVIDLLNNHWPTEFWGYRFMFLFCTFCCLLSIFIYRYYSKNNQNDQVH